MMPTESDKKAQELFQKLTQGDFTELAYDYIDVVGKDNESVGRRLGHLWDDYLARKKKTDSSLDKNLETLGPGDLCGVYRIEENLGEGGAGFVYLARRVDSLDMKVALKTISCWHPKIRNRFQTECQVLSGLKHPHIAHLIDAGVTDEGQPWLAMEYVEGVTLDQYLLTAQPGLKERLHLFLKICDAISHAHQQLVIHRDLKPGNIMVESNGEPKVLDFGIAASLDPYTGIQVSQTVRSEQMMTPEYASPEQIRGDRLGAISDVYSLGVVLYEMLTGQRPYEVEKQNPYHILKAIENQRIRRPSEVEQGMGRPLKGDLDAIVLKALMLDPSQRYNSVEALALDLRDYLAGLPVQARAAGRLYRFQKFVARNLWPVAVSSGLICILILFSVYAAYQKQLLEKERLQSEEQRQTAENVTNFLVSMFEKVNPELTPNRDVSAYEVMETARLQLGESTNQNPQVRIKLMTTMGRVYRALGHYQQSLQLLEKALLEADDKHGERYITELEWVKTIQQNGSYKLALQKLEAMEAQLGPSDPPLMRARLMLEQGRLWYQLGNYVQATKYYDAASEVFKSGTREEVAHFYQDRAMLQSSLGFYDKAIEELESLLRWQQTDFGSVHTSVAATHDNLGEQFFIKGDYDQAARHFEIAEEIYRKVVGDKHPLLISCKINRGRLKRMAGDFAGALSFYEDALAAVEELLGENHPQKAHLLNFFAEIYKDMGDIPKSEKTYRESLTLQQGILGDKHPDTAETMERLGTLFRIQGNYSSAERLYRQAMIIYTNHYGEKHIKIAALLDNLAVVMQDQGSFDQAESLFSNSIAMREELMGDHPFMALSCNNMAVLHSDRGDYINAEVWQRRALALFIRYWGETHPYVATSYNNLAGTLRAQGKLEDAEPLYHKGLEIKKKLLGEQHPSIAINLNNLGMLQVELWRFDEAFTSFQQALDMKRALLEEDHPSIATGIFTMGRLYFLKSELEKSEPLIKEALKRRSERYGEDHLITLKNQIWLARIAMERGAYQEAESILAAGFGQATLESSVALWCKYILDRGDLRLRTGQFQKAQEDFDKVLQLGKTQEQNLVKDVFFAHLALVDRAISTGNLEGTQIHLAEAETLQIHRQSIQYLWALNLRKARVLHFAKKYEDARILFEELLSQSRKALGEQHLKTASVQMDLAQLYVETHKVQQALPLIHQAQKTYRLLLPDSHENHGVALSLEGWAMLQDSAIYSRTEANEKLARAYDQLKQKLGEQHPLSRKAFLRLNPS